MGAFLQKPSPFSMTQSIDRYFSKGNSLAHMQAHAARLLRLQGQLRRLLPDYLGEACQVANLKDECLVVHVTSAALTVKLRQAVPSLLMEFARMGVALKDIKVKVTMPEYRPAPPPPEVRSVSAETRAQLQALAGQLPEDSPLARSLRKLVARARTRAPEGR
jgi:hypothetical protein